MKVLMSFKKNGGLKKNWVSLGAINGSIWLSIKTKGTHGTFLITHNRLLMVDYQPSKVNMCLIKAASGRGFVKMSAVFRAEATFWTLQVPFLTWSRKLWYLTAMCFVLGLYLLSSVAKTRQLALSFQIVVRGSDLKTLVLAARLNLFP